MCLAPAAAFGQDNQAPKGFTALFNGKDLTGWQGGIRIDKRLKMSPQDLEKAQAAEDKKMNEHWKVENGVLVNDGKGTNLASVKHFKNFELIVDWKINPKGDSGIYLRGIPQVQIWDSKSLGDRFKAEKDKGSGALWNNKSPAEKVPLAFADKAPGEWNRFHITMKGDKVSVKLNDVLVVDNVVLENIWERGNPLPERGPVELQYHPNQDGKADNLYFKNVFIKELPD
jgi:hypothetical protein